jgi:hypothetical protein
VQIDTGSADLGIPAWGCNSCITHDDKRYVPKQSETAIPITCADGAAMNLTCSPCHYHKQCAMTISYEDNSGFSADLWKDKVSFESTNSAATTAVVAGLYKDHRKNPMQPKMIDGIIGLAYHTVSSANTMTPLDYLVQDHSSSIDDVFALCLDSKSGGKLLIGSPNSDPYYKSMKNIQWANLLKKTYYPVNMTAFYVGKQRVNVAPSVYNRGDAIVDSGSTDITLPREAFDSFRDLMVEQCKKGKGLIGICQDEQGRKIQPGRGLFAGLCYTMSDKDIQSFPTLHVRLSDDISLPIVPSMYIRSGASYCDDLNQVGIAIDSGAVADGTLLGDVFMQGYLTIFDRKHDKIGFAPARDYC